MNYLNNKKVYLSGPIMNSADDGVKWREHVTPRLQKFGLEILDPCKKHIALGDEKLNEIGESKKKFRELILNEKWEEVKKDFWPIVRTDLKLVDKCDFIILDHDPTVPTVGTIHELVVATFEKKVILLKYNKSQLESFNPWICTFIKSHHFFSTWDSMFDYLEKVNRGELDTSYWIL